MSLDDQVEQIRKQIEMERQQDTARDHRAALIDIQSATFSQASTYTVIVIFGGYAALFTIWTYTRSVASMEMNVWVGLLLGISVLTFVLFEVFKMLFMANTMLKTRSILKEGLAPDEFLRRLNDVRSRSDHSLSWIVVPVWALALVVALVSGVASAALLFFTFAKYLTSP